MDYLALNPDSEKSCKKEPIGKTWILAVNKSI